jgi:TDG/mug DNA glycosylase family protein
MRLLIAQERARAAPFHLTPKQTFGILTRSASAPDFMNRAMKRPDPIARLAPLPDYLAPGLDIIFVGINPGEQSARAGHYYANPRNPFWQLLHAAALTARTLRPDEDHLLPSVGLGVTDIVKRPSRGLADLAGAEFRRGREVLAEKLLRYQPTIVCFNSMTGFSRFFGPGVTRRFGCHRLRIGDSRVFVVPSTSPANAAFSYQTKLRYFRGLKAWCDTLRNAECGMRAAGWRNGAR